MANSRIFNDIIGFNCNDNWIGTFKCRERNISQVRNIDGANYFVYENVDRVNEGGNATTPLIFVPCDNPNATSNDIITFIETDSSSIDYNKYHEPSMSSVHKVSINSVGLFEIPETIFEYNNHSLDVVIQSINVNCAGIKYIAKKFDYKDRVWVLNYPTSTSTTGRLCCFDLQGHILAEIEHTITNASYQKGAPIAIDDYCCVLTTSGSNQYYFTTYKIEEVSGTNPIQYTLRKIRTSETGIKKYVSTAYSFAYRGSNNQYYVVSTSNNTRETPVLYNINYGTVTRTESTTDRVQLQYFNVTPDYKFRGMFYYPSQHYPEYHLENTPDGAKSFNGNVTIGEDCGQVAMWPIINYTNSTYDLKRELFGIEISDASWTKTGNIKNIVFNDDFTSVNFGDMVISSGVDTLLTYGFLSDGINYYAVDATTNDINLKYSYSEDGWFRVAMIKEPEVEHVVHSALTENNKIIIKNEGYVYNTHEYFNNSYASVQCIKDCETTPLLNVVKMTVEGHDTNVTSISRLINKKSVSIDGVVTFKMNADTRLNMDVIDILFAIPDGYSAPTSYSDVQITTVSRNSLYAESYGTPSNGHIKIVVYGVQNDVASATLHIKPIFRKIEDSSVTLASNEYFELNVSHKKVNVTKTISYNRNGHGTAPSAKTVILPYNLLENDLPTLTETGWEFLGWTYDLEGTMKANIGDDVVGNITLFAQWKQNVWCTIIYVTAHGTVPSINVVKSGYKLKKLDIGLSSRDDLPTLTYPHYKHNGWKYSGTTTMAHYGDIITSNVTLVAEWESLSITLSYNRNGHGTAPSPKTVDKPYTITENDLPVLTEDGWRFNGWVLPNGDTPIVGVTQITNSTQLTANWTDVSIDLKYFYTHSYPGSAYSSLTAKTVDSPYTIVSADLPILSKDWWLFNGWNKSTNRTYTNAEIGDLLNYDTNFYDKWTEVLYYIEYTTTDGNVYNHIPLNTYFGNAILIGNIVIGDKCYLVFNEPPTEIPSVFKGSNILSMVIPGSVTTIDTEAFIESQISSVTFNEGLIEIGGSAFEGTYLQTVEIPNSVEIIGYKAFYEMHGALQSIVVGDNVQVIGALSFANNSNLSSVTMSWDESNKILYYDEDREWFVCCSSLNNSSFHYQYDLKADYSDNNWPTVSSDTLTLTIYGFNDEILFNEHVPNGSMFNPKLFNIPEVEGYTFIWFVDSNHNVVEDLYYINNDTTITLVYYEGIATKIKYKSSQRLWPVLGYNYAWDGSGNCTHPVDGRYDYYNANKGEGYFYCIGGDGITKIPVDAFAINGEGCFTNTQHITEIEIPDTVTSIDDGAFHACSSLKNIKLNKVETIGSNAFYGCSLLRKIEFNNYIPYIDDDAFYGCNNISNITCNQTNDDYIEPFNINCGLDGSKIDYYHYPDSARTYYQDKDWPL